MTDRESSNPSRWLLLQLLCAFFVSGGMVAYGVGSIYAPAGWIVGGLTLGALAWLFLTEADK